MEDLRGDVQELRAERRSEQDQARADRRTWLLVLLPTAAFVADMLVRVFVA